MKSQNLRQKINSGFHARGKGKRFDVILKEFNKNQNEFGIAKFEVNGLEDLAAFELRSGEKKELSDGLYVGISDPEKSKLLQIYCSYIPAYSINVKSYNK